jgi:hypothetical protein
MNSGNETPQVNDTRQVNENTEQPQQTPSQASIEKPLSLFQTIKSVLWAMLGIQSKENLRRDFTHGKARNFIITGLLFVILFVVTLVLIVKLVLHLAL